MIPPFRVSYGRTRRRRSHHAMKGYVAAVCPVSGQPKMHHRASPAGYVRPGLTVSVPKLGIGVKQD